MIRVLAGLIGLCFSAPSVFAACGATTESCALGQGVYEIELPEQTTKSIMPTVMFLHGAGGSGKTVMGNRRLIKSLLSRGYAVIAPTGSRQFGNSRGYVWNFYPGWDGRDAGQFLQDVAKDAAKRFDLDRSRMLLAGFSAGGFMVNYLACDTPKAFAAYASVSGGFWRPHPKECAGPVRLFHTHGWADKTVPLEGRSLRSGQFQQGDIFAGLEIWRQANKCANQDPDAYSETAIFWRRKWSDCAAGSALEMALFQGGHTVPKEWGDMALDWFETLAPIK